MACVALETTARPREVYDFFKQEGIEFIQFFPIVERIPDASSGRHGLRLGTPPALDREEENAAVTPWSVAPEAYGDFLIAVLDAWVRVDVGKVFVMNFEWMLNAWLGNPSPVSAVTAMSSSSAGGGCPKHRFLATCDDEPGLNYLCGGYGKFFRHSRKYLRVFRQLLENGLPASLVMDAIKGPLVIKRDR